MKVYKGSNWRAFVIMLLSMAIGWSIANAFKMDLNLSWAETYEAIRFSTLFGIVIGLTIGAFAFRNRVYRVEITDSEITGPSGYALWNKTFGASIDRRRSFRIRKGFLGYWTPFYGPRIIQGNEKIILSIGYFSKRQIDEIFESLRSSNLQDPKK